MRAVCACNKNTACTRHVPGRYTDSFPMCCCCQTYVRSERLVGFATAADRQRVEAVIHRAVRSWTVPFNIFTAAELIEDMDDNLFQWIVKDKNHILHALLPDQRCRMEYELRPRSHDRELVPKVNSLTESNFLIRQLYKNCY